MQGGEPRFSLQFRCDPRERTQSVLKTAKYGAPRTVSKTKGGRSMDRSTDHGIAVARTRSHQAFGDDQALFALARRSCSDAQRAIDEWRAYLRSVECRKAAVAR